MIVFPLRSLACLSNLSHVGRAFLIWGDFCAVGCSRFLCIPSWELSVCPKTISLFICAVQVMVPSCVGPVGALSCVTPSCFVMKSSLPSLLPNFVRKKKDGKNGKVETVKAKNIKPKMEMGYPVMHWTHLSPISLDLVPILPKTFNVSMSRWGFFLCCYGTLCSCVILLTLALENCVRLLPSQSS